MRKRSGLVWSGTWTPVSHSITGLIAICKLSSYDQSSAFHDSINSQKGTVLKDYILKAIITLGAKLGSTHNKGYSLQESRLQNGSAH